MRIPTILWRVGGAPLRLSALGAAIAFLAILPAAAQRSPSSANTPATKGMRPDVARFDQRVKATLAEEHSAKAYWGILVVDRDTGAPLYALNADRFFTPASNAKLVVATLALAKLGPLYQFRTTLESQGSLGTDGRLSGDLMLVGRGDPDLSNRRIPYAGKPEREGPTDKILAEMADAAVAKGLREVDGDIVGDDSYFPYDPYPAGWNVGDLFFAFGVPVSAIAFNDDTVSIEAQPGAHAGEPATITIDPAAASNNLKYEVTTVEAGAKSDFAVVRQPGEDFVLLRGTISVGRSPAKVELAMTDPAATAARALKQLLEARGVKVTGGIRAQHSPPPETTAGGEPILPRGFEQPPDPAPLVLAEHLSPPLLESVRIMNKVSQNLHAELFLRTVGREKLGLGSTAAGLKVERDFLREAGVADGDVVLSDGSGLSRDDLVTPRAIVALLQYALRQPWGKDFVSTLPIAGVDGTLEDRMRNSAASGMIEAKTGGIEHVRALSGYATTLRGEHLMFAIFCNNEPQHGTDAIDPLDAIATAMVETIGRTQPSKKKR